MTLTMSFHTLTEKTQLGISLEGLVSIILRAMSLLISTAHIKKAPALRLGL